LSADIYWIPDVPDGRLAILDWHCFAAAEVPIWKRLFHPPRWLDAAAAVSKLHGDLGTILAGSLDIKMVEDP
jgi:hypothetical protein